MDDFIKALESIGATNIDFRSDDGYEGKDSLLFDIDGKYFMIESGRTGNIKNGSYLTFVTGNVSDLGDISERCESPYLTRIKTEQVYNPNYGDDRVCECGHPYHRHFDSYDDMCNVGCKYCGCFEFVEKVET